MKILVVEDDRRLADLLQRILTEEGHQVQVRFDGPTGLLAASTDDLDGVVLDWALPGQDGPSVLRALRSRGLTVPVLMLTARHSVADRVVGLDAGADDYLGKPFSVDELLARLRVFDRRAAGVPVLTVAGITVDIERRTVTRDATPVELTAREFDILALLAARAGKVVSRFTILDEVWDGATDLRSNAIDVHVATLRGKVDKPFGRTTVQTVRGVGYRLQDETR